ncbi:UNVERIFIED_CONTAM: hypothetical protein Sradi_0568200 [Sesamum radiatum]|uniref:Pentatricopeptide repeat-containing protein n=1 Tax=Sesamum radiatum TaxID=300843 RepID=A0AAW2VMF9_SESRA
MSAVVRSNLKVCPSFPLFLHISSEALVHFRSVPRDRLRICPQLIQFVCFNSSSSSRVASKFDFLGQFSPFSSSYNDDSFNTVINSNERRKLAVGISKIIKHGKGYLLGRFSSNFCAFDLEIGEERSYRIVWQEYFKDALDFFILDALMRSFTNAEMASRALEVLGRMREVGGRPSVSAICVLLKLLLRFKFGCEPDVHTYNILINAYCVRGWTLDALNWVHLMVESGCNPSPATFSTIINAFCKEGNIAEARKIFDGMQEIGVFPNTALYNALMDGYVKAREIGLADMLYEEMRRKGVAPDSVTFNILAAGHYKFGKEEDGDQLLRNLSMIGVIPDSSLSDISIGGLWGED